MPAVPRGVMAFQPGEMIGPALALAACHLGIAELMHDIGKIGGERLAGEAFHILENECLGFRLVHDTDGLGPHIAAVIVAAVLTAKREWLAWGAAGHQLDTALVTPEIHMAHVPLNQGPLVDGRDAAGPVLADCVAAPTVPLDDLRREKPGSANADSEAAGSGEKFDRTHVSPVKNRRNLFSNCSLSPISHSHATKILHPAATNAA